MKLSWRQKEDIINLKKCGFSSRNIAKWILGREGRKSTVNDYTNISKFEAYQCNNCGKWFRGRKSINKDKEHIILGVII